MNVLSVKVKTATAAATWGWARAWGATTWDATTDVVKEFIKD